MHQKLTYETMEHLQIQRPVDRVDFISSLCKGKRVLDVGCFDETALIKRDTEHWLHGRIGAVALQVIGIDNSPKIPMEGLRTVDKSVILRGDGVNPNPSLTHDIVIDIIVAGEFIEHIESPMQFFRNMKANFSGKELIVSTPNGVSFANTLLGLMGREVQHRDHLHLFTFKTLNTICIRSGLCEWEIIPYRFYATEMLLNSRGAKRIFVRVVEMAIRVVERIFPLLSFGYVLRISV